MKRCTYSDSSIHEVVVLENILRERVLRGVFVNMVVVFYRILPTDVIRHICKIAYPLARSAQRDDRGRGDQGVFLIEYANEPVTTFYRVYS